jgi:hypothetical protein
MANTVFRKAVITECNRKKVDWTDTTATSVLLKRLQAKEDKKHKKEGTRGPIPNIKIKVMKNVLEKKGHGITGSLETLEERMKKISSSIKKKKSASKKNNVFYINKNVASADDAQELMGLSVGDVVKFKNGTMKKLAECSTGGYRWNKI